MAPEVFNVRPHRGGTMSLLDESEVSAAHSVGSSSAVSGLISCMPVIKYSISCDIWSLGIMFFELFARDSRGLADRPKSSLIVAGELAKDPKLAEEIELKRLKEIRRMAKNAPDWLVTTVEGMLVEDPEKRLTAAEIDEKFQGHSMLHRLQRRNADSKKKYAAFLSHHKASCAMEARFLKDKLQMQLPGSEIFLDSDDLKDLRTLLESVRDSSALVVLQSAEILYRPWCLLEMYAAIESGVPVVALNCQGKGYDFAQASQFLTNLDTQLEQKTPGAGKIISDESVDIRDLAFKLAHVIPNIISVDFNPSGSENSQAASIKDLMAAMEKATPVKLPDNKEEWLAHRR